MIVIKSLIHDIPSNSVEATWINADGVQVRCHSYADVQMQMLRDDALELGTLLAEYEDLIALVESKIVPYVQAPEDRAAIEAARVDALWQSAHDYETAQVSGSAIGLLAMGVMRGKPKCVAVQNWIKGIWVIYYERKANGSVNTDFSFNGSCPYTVPELMSELGL